MRFTQQWPGRMARRVVSSFLCVAAGVASWDCGGEDTTDPEWPSTSDGGTSSDYDCNEGVGGAECCRDCLSIDCPRQYERCETTFDLDNSGAGDCWENFYAVMECLATAVATAGAEYDYAESLEACSSEHIDYRLYQANELLICSNGEYGATNGICSYACFAYE